MTSGTQGTSASAAASAATGAAAGGSGDLPQDVARAVTDAIRDQKKRQERMRHVQEFLTSPVFIDMKDRPIPSGSDAEEIQDRRRDLKYRISVMESVLAVLMEELELIDRFLAKDQPAQPPQDAAAPEVPATDASA